MVEVRGDPPDPGVLAMVAGHLDGGGLVAMPTETVYGFGAALRREAIRDIQRLKARGMEKPFLVLISGPDSVTELQWTACARELAGVFWPGALTILLNDPRCRFPPGVRSAEGKVAIRWSPHPLAIGLLAALGEPIISTSVNLPGGSPALTARGAMKIAASLGGDASLWILDGGALPPSEASTMVDCSGPEPTVVRAGSIPVNRLRCLFPELKEPT